jgi:hypothetical protein
VIGADDAYARRSLVFIEDDLFRDGIGEEGDVGFALDKETSIGSNAIIYSVDAPEQTSQSALCCSASDINHQDSPFCSPWYTSTVSSPPLLTQAASSALRHSSISESG